MQIFSKCFAICTFVLFANASFVFAQKMKNENEKSDNGKPFLVRPTEAKNLQSTSETSSYLTGLLRLSKKDELRFESKTTDLQGFIHQQHQQFHNGIKVEYGKVTVHAKNNKIESVGGEVYNIPDALSSNPSVTEKTALQAALSFTNAKKYKWENVEEEAFLKKTQGQNASYFPKGSLVFVKIYVSGGGKGMDDISLAYKFDIYAEEPLSRKYIYVDAHTGAVIHINPIIKHVDGSAATRYSGTRTISTSLNTVGNAYWLRDNTRSSGVETYNLNNGSSYFDATDFIDTDNNWTDTEFNNSKKDNAALDAHWGAMRTYDFFLEKFNRNSYDNLGTKLRSYVHYGTNYVNAFWDGSVMTYGDGSGSIGPLTSLDICAHEIGHAVCISTADLVYENEPGALDESLSDIWGAAVEHYSAPEKSPWLLGEDINLVIRSMSNPNEHNQPDTYLGNFWDSNQAVHTNSGVMNHWYYILVEGKNGLDDNGRAYSVQGIGFENASKIVYRMETVYLTSNSQYSNARVAAIQAAIDLFGSTSNEVQQTRKAWSAVGVYDATSSPTSLFATASSSSSVNLVWTDNSNNENGFIVERSLSLNTGFNQIASIGANSTSYSDNELNSNTIYYYRVSASFIDYTSSFSNVASVALGTPPILMSNTTISTCSSVFLDPGGLGDYGNNQSITMRVNPAQSGKKTKVSFTSFLLGLNDYLSIYDGDVNSQNLLGSFTGNSIPPDINALNSTGHLTFVFFSNDNNTSAGWQANLSCETIPNAPTALIAITSTTTRINLTWEDNSSDETGFSIERKSGLAASPFVSIATVLSNTSSYSDDGLATDNTYSYRVKALNGSTGSSFSNIASASVGNPPLLIQNGIYQTCSSVFLDAGGSGNYGNSQSYVMRINPDEIGKKVKVSFSSFNLESGYDSLTIYDGDQQQTNLIGSYSGSSLPSDAVATNSTGSLTFVFFSDEWEVRTGWQATLSCVNPPQAPSNLIATSASNSQINLTWQDNSSDETSVVIERRSGLRPNSEFSAIATLAANSTSFSDQGLATNEKYYYRVRVSNSTAYSPYSNIADATLGTLALLMQNGTVQACGVTFLDPGGNGNYSGYQYISMRVNPEEGKKVKVSFSSFSLGAYDYLNIYDGEASTQNLIGSFTGTTIPQDINALNSMGYLTFFFYSSGSTPSAGWQATLSCVEVPSVPTNLIASASSGTEVNLTWQDNSTTETGFVIERKTLVTTAQFTAIATVGANTTEYSDQGLPTDTRYSYRIRAQNGSDYSSYSNTADVQLGNAPIIMGNGTLTTCNAQFFDSGYTNNYSNGENYTLTINPSAIGGKVKVTFASLSLESCCDALYIYDGPSTSSTLIGTYNGSTIPPVITATNSQGSLTFRFNSDGSATYSGWQASLQCVTPAPVITFNDINKVFGESAFDLNATAYPGADFVYSTAVDISNTAEISFSGVGNKTVSILKSGTIKLKAYLPAANGYPAAEKIATLTITKGIPVIAFNNLDKTFGDTPFDLNATAHPGSVFSYSIVSDPSNTAQVSLGGVNNKTITIAKAGIIKLKASLAETDNYSASEKIVTLTIGKATPVIAFNDLTKTFGDTPFELNAEAYTGSVFSYSVTDVNNNTGEVMLGGIENKSVSLVRAGIVNLKASLKETASYLASDKIIKLTINKSNQLITIGSIIDKLNTDSPFEVQATSSSGLPVSISVKSGPATISGNTLTLTKELGNVIIEGKQEGNANYLPATVASITFTVTLDPVLGFENFGKGIQIWPIPTRRFLAIKSESTKLSKVLITDLLGKEILSFQTDSSQIQIDLENFPDGLYMIKVFITDGFIVKRFIKLN